MKILIAGGSGLLGRALADVLRRDGHHIAVLTRVNVTEGEMQAQAQGVR